MSTNPIFQTDKYKNAEIKTYPSIQALSEATGLDKKLLKIAKQKNFDGFGANSNISWKRLKPVLEARYDELTTVAPTDIKTLKEEIAKRDIKLKDLEIKKREGNYLEPEEVKKLLVELATKTSVVIKKELNELPARCAGKSEIDIRIDVDKALQNIFKVLQSSEGKLDKYAEGN